MEKVRKFEATALKDEKETNRNIVSSSFLQVHTVDQTVHPPPSIALLASVCLMAAGPLLKSMIRKTGTLLKIEITNLKEKSVSQKLRSTSFSTERVRKIRHRVTRCLHTHTHRRY